MQTIRHFTLTVAVVALAACQETTTDNFINPPPGVPATCAQVASLPGCDQGSISYACTSERPDDVGSAAGKGDTAQLVCSDGEPGAGSQTLYCCIPLSQYFTDCAPDTSIPGCGAPAAGFSCTSQDGPPTTPSDADPTIACSSGQVGSGGAVRYCCNTAAIPPQCTVSGSESTCTGISVGYSCAGAATPGDGDPSLACAAGSAGSAGTDYCCVPFPSSPQTCEVDTTIVCPVGSYSFRCSGTNAPDALDPALACTQTSAGYCCTLTL
jgi:hypothetical protein